MSPRRLPFSTLPLKPNVYLILSALADGEAHGYAVRNHVRDQSDGQVMLDPGTLYRLIGRLMEDQLIEETDDRPDPNLDDARRRYYRLTEHGRMTFISETERMAQLVDSARVRHVIAVDTGTA